MRSKFVAQNVQTKHDEYAKADRWNVEHAFGDHKAEPHDARSGQERDYYQSQGHVHVSVTHQAIF